MIRPSRANPQAEGRARYQGRRRGRSERGSVLVEFALVATVLVSLILGLFEMGHLWSNRQALTHASRAGARVGSQMGQEPEADSSMLFAIEAALGDQAGDLTRVVVFEAGPDGAMPSACESAPAGYSGGSDCNVYDDIHLANLTTPGWWGSGSSCGSADANWCSVGERDTGQATATYLGVYVEVEHRFLTSLFGAGTITMSDTTVMRLEPNE